MQTVYYVREGQNVNNAIQLIKINILNMVILIASVIVQLTLIHTLTIQIQLIKNVFYVM